MACLKFAGRIYYILHPRRTAQRYICGMKRSGEREREKEMNRREVEGGSEGVQSKYVQPGKSKLGIPHMNV